MFRYVAVILLILSPFGAVAQGLSVAQIQERWAESENLSGRFREQYSTGEVVTGNFEIPNSTKLVIEYDRNGGVLTYERDLVIIEDRNSNLSNPVVHRDPRLGFVFSESPDVRGFVSRKGSNDDHTMLEFSDAEQSIRLFFSNESGRLSHLVVETPHGKTVTGLTYR